MAEFKGKKGRWITTKKNHRRVFIPEGKDTGEVLKEMFGKYNDDDYDFYEDGDEEEYKTYDADYDEEFVSDDDIRTELADQSWTISDDDTVDSFAQSIAEGLGIEKQRVIDIIKSEDPSKITEKTKMVDLLYPNEDEDQVDDNAAKDFDNEDLSYEEQPDGSIIESWSGAKYQDKKDLEDKAGSGALSHVRKKEKQENNEKKQQNKAFDIPTLDVSLKNSILNGEITLDEAAQKLNEAGWYNYKPSKEEVIKELELGNDFKELPLKRRLSKEEFDDLIKKDFKTLSEEDKDALIRAIRGTYKLK